MPFFNGTLKKKGLQSLVNYSHIRLGHEMTVKMLDDLKNLGFLYATKAGISIGIDDLVTPPMRRRALVDKAEKDVIAVEQQYLDGVITNGERYNKVIAIWSEVTDKVAKEMFKAMDEREKASGELNPILVMSDSGARGSAQQIRQLAGMRGLMAKPSGEIIETPIQCKLPRRPERVAVLHLDARRAQGSGRYGAEDRRLGLPDAPSGRRGAGRDHQRAGLRHAARHLGQRRSSKAARRSNRCATASSAALALDDVIDPVEGTRDRRGQSRRSTKTLRLRFSVRACSACAFVRC